VTSFAQHSRARTWWGRIVNGDEPIGVAAVVLFGFLRLVTNRRVLARPLGSSDALDTVQEWFASPVVSLLVPGPRHLEIAFALLRRLTVAADLTTDVQIAALAIENQAEVHSHDRDFARFPGLRWVDPLA
jgi:toxin-antitoxin system PIN domain toxin